MSLKSTGLGPAEIRQFTVIVDKKTFDLTNMIGALELRSCYEQVISKVWVIGSGIYLLPGGKFEGMSFFPDNKPAVEQFIGKLKVWVTYLSVYKEKFEVELKR